MAGRKLASYERKYGVEAGRKLYSALQKEAAQSSAKARYKKKLQRAGLLPPR